MQRLLLEAQEGGDPVTILRIASLATILAAGWLLAAASLAAPNCDRDEDGFLATTGRCGGNDCDDRDATVFPGAPEVCGNAVDEDCNGLADDGCQAPPVCGDGIVNQPAEDCDGSDDAACPGLCQADCTCGASAPVCGDSSCDREEDCASCEVDCGVCTGGDFLVGFAVQDVTPTSSNGYSRSMSGVSLGGYGSSCPLFGIGRRGASGVHDRIYARAFVIDTGAESVAFVMIDAVGAGNRTTIPIQVQASSATGIPSDRILVGASHSHSAPDLVGLWSQWRAVDNADFQAYRDFVIGKAVEAVRLAWEGRQPADLHASQGSLERANNRRGWGFTDTDLVVLDARAASTGERIGTLVSWAAHPTVLGSSNSQISRDYQGYAVNALEAVLGAERVAYWNGAFGDASPDALSGDFAGAQELGEAVASAALATMGSSTPVGPGLVFSRSDFVQCVTNSDFLLAMDSACMDYDLAPAPGGCSSGRAIGSYVAYLRLGQEVQVAVTPGEALTRLAIGDASLEGVKDVMQPGAVKLWLDPAPDFLGYLISCDEFGNPPPGDDGYEEGVSLGSCADSWIADPLKAMIRGDAF